MIKKIVAGAVFATAVALAPALALAQEADHKVVHHHVVHHRVVHHHVVHHRVVHHHVVRHHDTEKKG